MTTQVPARIPAVRPRDAASLIVVRRVAHGEAEVLMGRRAKRSRFMPDVFVFPGGVVEPADSRAQAATPLDVSHIAQMAVGGRAARARTLAMAAVRETYEETGLLVGGPGHPGRIGGTYADIAATGVAPALDALHYVGRAITPVFMPMRFHARFFVADAARASGELRSSGELVNLAWVPLASTPELPIADVTRFILAHVSALEAAPPDVEVGRAFFTYRNRGRLIQFHGGPPPPAWNRAAFDHAAGPPATRAR